MKVLKSTILKKRKCEFGNFELVPEAGWKISQAFIDFESGLLVVSESDENEDNWIDTGFGSRTIPNKETIIDVDTGEILTREVWSKRFSYIPVITISEDGKYELTTTRVHNKERDSDSIEEELIEIETNKMLSSGSGIAFREKKRVTALENFLRQKKEHEKRQAELDALPTLEELFKLELKSLEEGEIILNYHNDASIFELSFNKNQFLLKRANERFNSPLNWQELEFEKIETFEKIEDFISKYMTNKDWYLSNIPIKRFGSRTPVNHLLKKEVVQFCNKQREKHDFTTYEYNKLNNWENLFNRRECVKPSEYKQYCSNCKKPVRYNPRYPKYICGECSSKTITDEVGNEISFSNIGFSGGLRISYIKDGKAYKDDTSQTEKLCIIDGKRFIATEARFGGIVIESET